MLLRQFSFLVAITAALMVALPASAANRVALVIGNDAYQHLAPLQKAVNDARAVGDALSAIGFQVFKGENLTRRETNRLVANFEASLRPGDQAFVFFAGHGVSIRGENILIPVDMPKPNNNDEELVRDEGTITDNLVRRVQARGAGLAIFVIDACRDNPFEATGVRSIGTARGLARTEAPQGVLMIHSASPGQTALDRLSDADPDPNSVFTRQLVPLLREPGLDHFTLAKRLQTGVYQLAGTIRHNQLPDYVDRVIGQVVINPGEPRPAAGGTALQPTPAAPATAPSPSPVQPPASPPTQLAGTFPMDRPIWCSDRPRLVSVLGRPARPLSPEEAGCLQPKEVFKECDNCPEMVVVPAGSFNMGSRYEAGADADERLHPVTIGRAFAVGRLEVTFAEWDTCVAGGGCNGYRPKDEGWGRGRQPVINVSWTDAKAYVAWLSRVTAQPYRLLTEAEWEYIARGGTTTPFWWGELISTDQANYDGNRVYSGGQSGLYRKRTVAADSFSANPFGVFQVHGNVLEWVEDCWVKNYTVAQTDGSAQLTEGCDNRVLRGGSWVSDPSKLRSASRIRDNPNSRGYAIGFRVARTL